MGKPRKRAVASPVRQALADTPEDAGTHSLWGDPFVHVMLILGAGFAVYSTIITAPFFFDDYLFLVNNPIIKDLSLFADTKRVLPLGVFDDIKNNLFLRPVTYFSFALDYALHGLDVRGYHLVNLLLHLGNALLVYLLMWLTLRTPFMKQEAGGGDGWSEQTYRYLPLFCSLLFVCHPLQTQAVTYIIQRFVPLATFFCLAALVGYVNGRLSPRGSVRAASYLTALVSCVLAMKSKEIAFTLPILIALYEGIFFTGTVGARLLRLVPFLLTMAIIPLKLMELAALAKSDASGAVTDAVNLVNFRGTSSWTYLMSQFGVITTYLRLLILPVNQNFDYDYPLRTNFFTPGVMLPLALLLGIAGMGIRLLIRSRNERHPTAKLYAIVAFGIFWFFTTLSVESSIIPIDDLIFEHRAYLPSIGFFMATLAGAASWYSLRREQSIFTTRLTVGILLIVVISYAAAGFLRNRVWEDRVAFWRDVVAKSPNKARAHIALGSTLVDHLKFKLFDPSSPGIRLNRLDEGQLDEAIREFRTAIKLNPKSELAYMNLGICLTIQKRYDDATDILTTAIAMNPRNPYSHVYLGKLFESRGDFFAARMQYLKAIDLSPAIPDGHRFLGALSARQGEYAEALKEYEIAFRLCPDDTLRLRIAGLKAKAGGQ